MKKGLWEKLTIALFISIFVLGCGKVNELQKKADDLVKESEKIAKDLSTASEGLSKSSKELSVASKESPVGSKTWSFPSNVPARIQDKLSDELEFEAIKNELKITQIVRADKIQDNPVVEVWAVFVKCKTKYGVEMQRPLSISLKK